MVKDEGSIPVVLNCNLAALRVVYKSICNSYDNWPGGDPEEQVNLEKIKKDLYAVLYSILLENDLV